MTKKNGLIAARLLFGLLTLFAIGLQLSIHMSKGYDVVNFFSYFTNLSNIFAAIVLIIGAFYLAKRRRLPKRFEIIRGAAAVMMAVVGITFVTLLREEDLGSLLPWVNTLLHYVMPVAVIADWLLSPPKTKLTVRHLLLWLIFPLIYLFYSITRGAATGWYAYPFFNPDKVNGYGGVALYCVGILAMFLVVSWLLRLIANKQVSLQK